MCSFRKGCGNFVHLYIKQRVSRWKSITYEFFRFLTILADFGFSTQPIDYQRVTRIWLPLKISSQKKFLGLHHHPFQPRLADPLAPFRTLFQAVTATQWPMAKHNHNHRPNPNPKNPENHTENSEHAKSFPSFPPLHRFARSIFGLSKVQRLDSLGSVCSIEKKR